MERMNASEVEFLVLKSAWRVMAASWELTPRELRDLLPEGGQRDAAPPRDTERRMRMLVEIGHRLRIREDGELADWLRTGSEVLGYHTPLEVMSGAIGDLRAFRNLVEQGFGA